MKTLWTDPDVLFEVLLFSPILVFALIIPVGFVACAFGVDIAGLCEGCK